MHLRRIALACALMVLTVTDAASLGSSIVNAYRKAVIARAQSGATVTTDAAAAAAAVQSELSLPSNHQAVPVRATIENTLRVLRKVPGATAVDAAITASSSDPHTDSALPQARQTESPPKASSPEPEPEPLSAVPSTGRITESALPGNARVISLSSNSQDTDTDVPLIGTVSLEPKYLWTRKFCN